MADRIVVMQHGVVEQVGAPLELYDRPANLFVAGFIGSPAMNFIEAKVHRNGGPPVAIAGDGTKLPLPADAPLHDATDIVYGVRPEHLLLRETGDALPAEVIVVEPTGAETLVVTRLAGLECKAVFRERHRLAPGRAYRPRAAARPGPRVRPDHRPAFVTITLNSVRTREM